MWEDQYSYDGDGTGGVVNRTTHFTPQKVDFVTDRYDVFNHIRVIRQHPMCNNI